MSIEDDLAELTLGGRSVRARDAWNRLARYCGVPWDDHPAETWAYRYYDAITTDPDVVTAQDVVCTGALHPGLTRDDLAWFWDHQTQLNDWLNSFPADESLRTADENSIARLAELPASFPGPSLSLLSKVLHRKRPWFIPLIDREIIDWYRPRTGQRRAVEAWAPLLHVLRDDLESNRDHLAELRFVLGMLHGAWITDVRTVDIVIWMAAQR